MINNIQDLFNYSQNKLELATQNLPRNLRSTVPELTVELFIDALRKYNAHEESLWGKPTGVIIPESATQLSDIQISEAYDWQNYAYSFDIKKAVEIPSDTPEVEEKTRRADDIIRSMDEIGSNMNRAVLEFKRYETLARWLYEMRKDLFLSIWWEEKYSRPVNSARSKLKLY